MIQHHTWDGKKGWCGWLNFFYFQIRIFFFHSTLRLRYSVPHFLIKNSVRSFFFGNNNKKFFSLLLSAVWKLQLFVLFTILLFLITFLYDGALLHLVRVRIVNVLAHLHINMHTLHMRRRAYWKNAYHTDRVIFIFLFLLFTRNEISILFKCLLVKNIPEPTWMETKKKIVFNSNIHFYISFRFFFAVNSRNKYNFFFLRCNQENSCISLFHLISGKWERIEKSKKKISLKLCFVGYDCCCCCYSFLSIEFGSVQRYGIQ